MRSIPVTALTMTFLMLLSALGAGWISLDNEETPSELEMIPEKMEATSPNHVVFGQYITSDNCGYCYQYGSPAHHGLKTSFPTEYVYIALQSVSYGTTNTARAGNVGVYNWPWSTGGAPDAYFGDRIDQRKSGCGTSTCYDAMFSSGGGMASTVNDYQMAAQTVANGANIDIQIAYRYVGTGTAASNLYMYSALTEETCQYTYSDGSKGHNCWKAWLTDGGTYVNQNNGGGGSSFESISPTSSWQTLSWTVPASLVNGGGAGNALAIGAIMSGAPSTGTNSGHTYHATDSGMGALIDIAIQDFTATNPSGADSWISGDVLTLSTTIRNLGVEEYADGGMIKFVSVNGASETEIGSAIINTLSTSGSASTQTFTTTFDTTSLDAGAWDASIRVRVTDLTGDGKVLNDMLALNVLHDMAPISGSPTVIGDPEVERGDTISIEVRGDPQDGVDTMETMTPKFEFSVAGMDSWFDNGVMGGETLMGLGTSNERYEFQLEPDSTMASGLYDIHVRFVDAGGQESHWVVKEDAFSLKNGLPVIVPEPYPSVKVGEETPVSMSTHISDTESLLSELTITSTSPNFISWNSATEKMTVVFNNIQRDVHGTPMPSGIYITIDDGEDTTSGTLLFNVIENGQPRWGALPSIHIDEGNSESIMLSNYLSDTDENGASVDSSSLIVTVLENDNTDLITASVNGQTLNIETMDQDVFGQARLTLSADDGTNISTTVVIVSVNNINDAPTIDLSEFDGMMLKKNDEKIIMLTDYMDDVDDENNEILVSVAASPAHSARYNMLSNALTLGWDTTGEKTVMITVIDRHDDSTTSTFTVTVYDALPLYVSASDSSADIFVEMENGLVGKDARVTLTVINTNLGLNHLSSEWQICSILDGICYDGQTIEHTGVQTSWSFFLPFERSSDGLLYNDQLKLVNFKAVDLDGNDRKFHGPIYWNITEFPVDPTAMDSKELDAHIMTLENRIAALEVAISNLEEGTDEFVEKKSELDSAEDDYQDACAVEGAECISDDVQSQSESVESGSLNFTYIGTGMAVIILILLSVLVMGGRKGDGDSFAVIDHTMALPATDAMANSAFGGAQELFAAPPPQAGPPIPADGLPVGWTMEQWHHYGAQYLQQNGL